MCIMKTEDQEYLKELKELEPNELMGRIRKTVDDFVL